MIVHHLRYAAIRDNTALTRTEEREDLAALFDILPKKVRVEVILSARRMICVSCPDHY